MTGLRTLRSQSVNIGERSEIRLGGQKARPPFAKANRRISPSALYLQKFKAVGSLGSGFAPSSPAPQRTKNTESRGTLYFLFGAGDEGAKPLPRLPPALNFCRYTAEGEIRRFALANGGHAF